MSLSDVTRLYETILDFFTYHRPDLVPARAAKEGTSEKVTRTASLIHSAVFTERHLSEAAVGITGTRPLDLDVEAATPQLSHSASRHHR